MYYVWERRYNVVLLCYRAREKAKKRRSRGHLDKVRHFTFAFKYSITRKSGKNKIIRNPLNMQFVFIYNNSMYFDLT